MNFKKGFTLAEVLITLGIIGIVAALTLPSLIQKHQKQVWVNQLKKSVTVWENGMKMMLADAETDDLTNTEFWQYLQSFDGVYACTRDEPYTTGNNILKKYFKILNIQDTYKEDQSICSFGEHPKAYVQLNGEPYGCDDCDAISIRMADGTLFGLFAHAKADPNGDVGTLEIDVNGENKGPNQWGRDAFSFRLYKNGTVKPECTYEYLKEYPFMCGNIETGDISEAMGVGCAVRIIHDGWKMNY